MHNSKTNSFKVTVPDTSFSSVVKSNKWPKNVKVGAFKPRRLKGGSAAAIRVPVKHQALKTQRPAHSALKAVSGSQKQNRNKPFAKRKVADAAHVDFPTVMHQSPPAMQQPPPLMQLPPQPFSSWPPYGWPPAPPHRAWGQPPLSTVLPSYSFWNQNN